MTKEQLLQKIWKAHQDIGPRMNIEVYDALIEDLAFDYVEEGAPSLEFYGMKSYGARKDLVNFFRELIKSLCMTNGIVFFYSPPEEDKILYGT